MRIEADLKLDFDDVLIRPKRSVAPSRASVDLQRSFRFRNFREALTFVQEIGELAEAEGHHPVDELVVLVVDRPVGAQEVGRPRHALRGRPLAADRPGRVGRDREEDDEGDNRRREEQDDGPEHAADHAA